MAASYDSDMINDLEFGDITLDEIGDEFKYDKVLAYIIIKNRGEALLDTHFKNDRDFVLEAVTLNGQALEFAPVEFRNDPEIVKTAMINNRFEPSLPFLYASNRLSMDKEFVIEAVNIDGLALEFTSEDLKNDLDVVMAAVANTGSALQFASEDLQDDRDVVLAAVRNDGLALEFASDDLQDDTYVVNVATRQCSSALIYGTDRVQQIIQTRQTNSINNDNV